MLTLSRVYYMLNCHAVKMTFYTFSALCVIAFGLCVAGELTLPFTTCKRNSTKYSSCLKRALKEAWPRFVDGLPEYNFPTLDPFHYDIFHATYETNEIYGEVTVHNLNMTGIGKTRFFGVRTHFLPNDFFRLEVDCLVPSIFTEGNLNARGTLLNTITMGESGYYNATLEHCKATWDITGHVVNDTLIVEHFHTIPEIGNLKAYTRDFYDNDPDMNNLIMSIVNEYWPLLYRVMIPVTTKEWDERITNELNPFFAKIPFSQMFP